MEWDLIVTIVNRGYSDLVMDAARSRGATGGTIINGRGTLTENAEKFFNVAVQPEKELVLTLVAHEKRTEIMQEIALKAGLKTEGQGIAFSMPVNEAIGLDRT